MKTFLWVVLQRKIGSDSTPTDPGRTDLTREMNWAPGQKSAVSQSLFPRFRN
jgi:hypothetical protein